MINSIGKSHMVSKHYSGKTISTVIKLPTVPKMKTKGQCKCSEEELVKKVVKLAQHDAALGTNSQIGAIKNNGVRTGTAEWKKLRDDFISLASPDRAKLIPNTLSSLAEQISTMGINGKNYRFEFFEILFGNSKKFGYDVGGNYVTFRDEQGNEIAEYSIPNGWNEIFTPAERARLHAFNDLWNQALADAEADLEQEPRQIPEEISGKEIEMSFLV